MQSLRIESLRGFGGLLHFGGALIKNLGLPSGAVPPAL